MKLFGNKVFLLLIIAIAVRIFFSIRCDLRTFPDSKLYFETGRQLVTGDYSDYNGKRAPVYPLLIAATGFNREVTVFFQVAMGVGISLLLYLIFSKLTGSSMAGFLAGLVHALNPAMIGYEFTLCSETTCAFFLILSIFLLFRFIAQKRIPSAGELIILGIASGLCLLTRPMYQFFPVFLTAALIFYLSRRKMAVWKVVLFIVPVMITTIPWGIFQYKRIGQFVITPDIGYAIMYHTVRFIEEAPDEYDDIKQVLIKHREHKIRAGAKSYDSCLEASRVELQELTGLPYAELSRKLAWISIKTITEEPILYLRGVVRAFFRFFKPFWPGHLYGVRPAVMEGGWLLRSVIATYAAFFLFSLAILLFLPVLTIISPSWRKAFRWHFNTVFFYSLLLVTAGFPAFLTFSDNARFHASIEPVILGFAISIFFTAWRKGLLNLYTLLRQARK